MSEIEQQKDQTEETPELLAEPPPAMKSKPKNPLPNKPASPNRRNRFDCRDVFARSRAWCAKMIFAHYFGAGFLYDAYQVAFTHSERFARFFRRRRFVRRVRQSFHRLSNQQKRSRSVATGESGFQRFSRRFERRRRLSEFCLTPYLISIARLRIFARKSRARP